MPDKSEIPPSPTEFVKAFIETLDKLAYEKPAGFAAYMALCMAHEAKSVFNAATEERPKK